MCKILIPGLDYNLCDTCGYVATETTVNQLRTNIKELENMAKKSKSKTKTTQILSLEKTLNQLEGKLNICVARE
jgi:hypothetical protein